MGIPGEAGFEVVHVAGSGVVMVVLVLAGEWEAEGYGNAGRRSGRLGPDEGVGAAEKGGRPRAASMEGEGGDRRDTE